MEKKHLATFSPKPGFQDNNLNVPDGQTFVMNDSMPIAYNIGIANLGANASILVQTDWGLTAQQLIAGDGSAIIFQGANWPSAARAHGADGNSIPKGYLVIGTITGNLQIRVEGGDGQDGGNGIPGIENGNGFGGGNGAPGTIINVSYQHLAGNITTNIQPAMPGKGGAPAPGGIPGTDGLPGLPSEIDINQVA